MDLPTYTNIWRIEKRLYKLYDLRLPMPLPLVQIGVFLGVFVPWILLLRLVGVPFESPWHVLYIVPPGVLTWLATRPVIEGKRLTELLLSQSRYLAEPRTWCRLTPIREPREVVIVARVWRRAEGPAPVAAAERAAIKTRRKRRHADPEPTPLPARLPRPATAAAPPPLVEYAAQQEQPAAAPPKPWRRTTRDNFHEDDVLPLPTADMERPPATPQLETPAGSGKRALASGVRRPGAPAEIWQAAPATRPDIPQQHPADIRRAAEEIANGPREPAHPPTPPRHAPAPPGSAAPAPNAPTADPTAPNTPPQQTTPPAATRQPGSTPATGVPATGRATAGGPAPHTAPPEPTRQPGPPPATGVPTPGRPAPAPQATPPEATRPGSTPATGVPAAGRPASGGPASEAALPETTRQPGATPAAGVPAAGRAASGGPAPETPPSEVTRPGSTPATGVPTAGAGAASGASPEPTQPESTRQQSPTHPIRATGVPAPGPAATGGPTSEPASSERGRQSSSTDPAGVPAPGTVPSEGTRQSGPAQPGRPTGVPVAGAAAAGAAPSPAGAVPADGSGVESGQRAQETAPGGGASGGEPGDKKVAGPRAPVPPPPPWAPPVTRPDVPMVPGAFGAPPRAVPPAPRREPPKPWSEGLSRPQRPAAETPPQPVEPAAAQQVPPPAPPVEEQAPPREVRSQPASPVRPRPLPPPPAPPPSGPAITPPGPEHEVSTGGFRRLIHAVGGGHGEVDAEYQQRLQQPFHGTRHVVVLGCTGGAGQTVTALMLGHTFAQHNGEPVVAIDVNPGPGALARRTRSDTNETLTGLITRADQVGSLTAMRRYTSQAKSGLDVIAAGKNPLQALDDRDYALAIRTIDKFYSVTLLDAAAAVVARVLPYADQIVLVAPASADAPRAVAMTFEWLDGHGYEELRSRAVTVINGVSRRSMDDVEQAEAVARGRCRALVRIPWDDHLSMDRAPRNELKSLRTPTRRAYLALAGVVAGGFTVMPERYQELQQEQEATR
ncbi:TcpE family conjugal transfer membrane protein [Actinomadura sp. NPDC049382]|uniref:TcpE family conjugal transfer membrane protein n=1 Tax=Actinomadura sp. NPDC049382 TaxID=3158220 RepID=UPI003447C906